MNVDIGLFIMFDAINKGFCGIWGLVSEIFAPKRGSPTKVLPENMVDDPKRC